MSVLTFPTSSQRKPGPAYPILELFPEQGQWSEEAYLRLTDHAKKLVEYTDGCIEVLPMPTENHQHVLAYLYRALFAFAAANDLGEVLFAALRVRIRAGMFREPDLLFVSHANTHL